MNLVIDMGNTAVKAAVFQNNKLLEKFQFPREYFFKKNQEIFNSYPKIEYSILSSVVITNQSEVDLLQERSKLQILNKDLLLPFTNLYKTPETLGIDRLALIGGAAGAFPKKNVLVIDAGTCITFDFKNDQNEYFGGAISPGIRMRLKALHTFTSKLPLIEFKEDAELIGGDTEGSILSGVINGTVAEIAEIINTYKSKYKDLTVILTGGDTQFLSKRLKNSIFANSNFLLEGLNYILEFNKTQ